MSPENKQRLVGIIVLVAFVALLIPFLFTSGIKKTSQPEPVVNEAIPIQPLATPPAVNEPTVPVTNEPQPLVNQPISQPEVLPKEESKEEPLPIEGIKVEPQPPVNQPVAALPVTTEDIAAAEAEVIKGKTPAPVTKQAKNRLKSKIKSAVKKPGRLWSVQVGSFSDQERMQKLVDSLQRQGFKVFLQKINTSRGVMVRVLVGREVSQAKAAKLATQLKTKLKINGRVVGNTK